VFSGLMVTNEVGLSVVTRWTLGALGLATPARVLLALAGIALFLRAVWRLREAWEAPLAGLALIPFLTDPNNYYYAFVPLGFVLAERRPAAAGVLWAACLAWNLNGRLLYHSYEEYFVASIIAVVSSAGLLAVLGSPAPEAGASAAPEAGVGPAPERA